MRPNFLVALALAGFTILSLSSTNAAAAHTRVTYPGAFSIELLGRAMMYSVNYDQVLNDNLAVGVGIGSAATMTHGTEIDTDKDAVLVPAYVNYYFIKDAGSPFMTAGFDLVTNHSSVKGFETKTGNLEIGSSSVMPTIGGGYENRGDNGFLFRGAAYFIAGKKLTPWIGFSIGYGF